MTEKDIQLLGFTKRYVSEEESGEKPYHYYIYEFTKGLEFITPDNESIKKDNWYVEFFNTEIPIRFYNFIDVKALIDTFEKAKIINN
jgi:hypothetical protein